RVQQLISRCWVGYRTDRIAPEGPYFYSGQSILPSPPDCSARVSVRGPKCPVPPRSRTVKEPRTPRLFHFSEWICISQNFNDRRARAAKRKGQADVKQTWPYRHRFY